MELLRIAAHGHDWCTVLTLAGELDLYTAPQLHRQIEASQARSPHLVFDLAHLTFMDSSGLQVIRDAHTHAMGTSATVAVIGVTGAPQRLLHLTALHHQLPTFPTLEEALAATCAAPQIH